MNKLKQEYILQVRNSIIQFLVNNMRMNVTDVAEIFSMDKSTASRIAKARSNVDKGLLMDLTKFFK